MTRRRKPAGRSGLDERDAMSVETCARLIVEGSAARRRVSAARGKGGVGASYSAEVVVAAEAEVANRSSRRSLRPRYYRCCRWVQPGTPTANPLGAQALSDNQLRFNDN